jgi:hypothetical protein
LAIAVSFHVRCRPSTGEAERLFRIVAEPAATLAGAGALHDIPAMNRRHARNRDDVAALDAALARLFLGYEVRAGRTA